MSPCSVAPVDGVPRSRSPPQTVPRSRSWSCVWVPFLVGRCRLVPFFGCAIVTLNVVRFRVAFSSVANSSVAYAIIPRSFGYASGPPRRFALYRLRSVALWSLRAISLVVYPIVPCGSGPPTSAVAAAAPLTLSPLSCRRAAAAAWSVLGLPRFIATAAAGWAVEVIL